MWKLGCRLNHCKANLNQIKICIRCQTAVSCWGGEVEIRPSWPCPVKGTPFASASTTGGDIRMHIFGRRPFYVETTARLSVLKYFPAAGNRIHIHSFTDGVEIGLGTETLNRLSHVASRTPIGDSVELWLQPKKDLIAARPITELLISTAPAWLSAYLSHNPTLFEPHAKKITIQPHDGWLVLQLHE